MSIQLKDFVSESLKQIIQGVQSAQDFAEENQAKVAPAGIYGTTPEYAAQLGIIGKGEDYLIPIDFNIAVTASESEEASGGIGVLVSVLGASVKGKSEETSSTVSRIKFIIPISLPKQGNPKPKRPKKTSGSAASALSSS